MAGTYKKDGQECTLITPEELKKLEESSKSIYFSAAYPGKGSMRVGDFYAIEFGNIHVFHTLEELDTVIETDLQKRLRETMVEDNESLDAKLNRYSSGNGFTSNGNDDNEHNRDDGRDGR